MLCKVTYCAGRVSANTRPHQPHWGDQGWGLYNLKIVVVTLGSVHFTSTQYHGLSIVSTVLTLFE